MKEIAIKINMDNDAFYDDCSTEVKRILQNIINGGMIDHITGIESHRLLDVNGNICGICTWEVTE